MLPVNRSELGQVDADVHEHGVETFSEPFEGGRGVSPGGRPGFQVMDLIDAGPWWCPTCGALG